MKRFVQSFPFMMVAAVCVHVACGDADQGTGSTGVGPVGSQGTGYSPACNLDRRDGYCNALGQNPETCECFDCVDSAKCTGKCNDNGACDGEEDCTCIDCNGNGECVPPDPETTSTTAETTTADTTTVTSGGGGPATTTVATTTSGMGGMGMGGQGGQ